MSSMETDLLDSEMGLEDDSSESDLGDEGGEYSDEGMDEPETPMGKNGEMIESYDRRELIALEGDIDMEPYEGMEFDSEDAARDFYNAYARRTGFRVRVSKCRRSMRDGTIICRRFVCSKEGFYMQKNQARSKRQRLITRVGCMAMLLVKKQNSGKWLVTKFEKEHNHEPVAPRKVDLKPRAIMEVKKVENSIEKMESPIAQEIVQRAPPQGSSNLELYEGMEFQSEDGARTYYYAYAKDMGFTVRISKCRRARDGSIICRRFVCSKEGYYVRKFGRTKRSRALTRVGCLARLIVKKLDSGIWIVADFEREHNHPPFVIGNELSYQPPKPPKRINRGARAALPAPTGSVLSRCEMELQNSQNSVTWRFNKLHQEGIKFAEEGATSVEIFNVAMFALREATQKVVAAKKDARVPQLGYLVSGTNHGGHTNQIICANNSGNQTTMSNAQSEGKPAVSSSGVMLIQHPMNLVLIAPGLPNGSGQSPLAINIPNGQALQGGAENQQLNVTVPITVQKHMLPSAQRLDGNGSGMSTERKRKHRTAEDDIENFVAVQDSGDGDSIQDGTATQPQAWNILGMDQAGSNLGNGDNSTSVALSEAQVAALQAVADAFNVPTMGATSSSALPIKVSPVSDELSEGNKGYSFHGSPHQSLDMLSPDSQLTPRTPSGPNPLVHAAAIAAGARIASPAAAASLIKAVQSRTAVHIRSGGSLPKLPLRVCGESLASRSSGAQQPSNIHYVRTGEPSIPTFNPGVIPNVTAPGTQQFEANDIQTAIDEQTYMSNANISQDQTMDHNMVDETFTMAELQHTGSMTE